MHKIHRTALLASFMIGTLSMSASPASADEQATAKSAGYSVADTPVGQLIDDPRAAAILQRLIPTVWKNEMFQSMGRDLTLKAIQQYEGVLTDEKLAEIQAELDKLPPKD